jgi:chromatin remodeling complex protein RSC6
MLTGFNTNIRHCGVLFHVQSEDSGRAHPHIITHLYHGGTIIFSEKSSYASRVGEANLEDVVRELMEGQHKAVLKRLRAGDFNDAIRERLGDVLTPSENDTKAKTKPTETSPLADETPSESAVLATPEPAHAPRSFGEGVVSERPLDDVILGYLIENARKRRAKT